LPSAGFHAKALLMVIVVRIHRGSKSMEPLILVRKISPRYAMLAPIHAEERCGASIFFFCAGKDLHECVEYTRTKFPMCGLRGWTALP
jgi:hypothetical protein